jgi:hypothetical protein
MSFIGGGGSGHVIGPGQTQNWIFTWNNSGWQGNTFNEPQPLNPNASLVYSAGSVVMNPNGTYSFSWSVRNTSAFATVYNLQTSSNWQEKEIRYMKAQIIHDAQGRIRCD